MRQAMQQGNTIRIAYELVRKVSDRMLVLDTFPQNEASHEILQTLDSGINAITQELRIATGSRLEDFNDSELILLAYLFIQIWGGKGVAPRITANNIRDLFGSDLAVSSTLLLALTSGDSPLIDVMSLDWRADGTFSLFVSEPNQLHSLFFGEVHNNKAIGE